MESKSRLGLEKSSAGGSSLPEAVAGERLGSFKDDKIHFTSDIPSGNGFMFRKLAPDTFRFHIRNNGESFAQYFHIEIHSEILPRQLRLQVADGVAWGRPALAYTWYKPVIRPAGRNQNRWETVPDMTARLISNGAVIGEQMVEYSFTIHESPIRFASVIPHTWPDLESWLERIKGWSGVQVGTAGSTVLGHRIPMIDISAGRPEAAAGEKVRIFLMAGQHPAETESRYVLQYLVESILKQPDLLDRFTFKIVPMVNVDGVVSGRSYTNIRDINLNMAWHEAEEETAQPEISSLYRQIKDFRPHLLVDMHSGAFPFVCRFSYAMNEAERQMLEVEIRKALHELPFGHMLPAAERSVDVLWNKGLVKAAFVLEVSRLPNDLSWYERQAAELLRLITGFAARLAGGRLISSSRPVAYRFSLPHFGERLPAFYYHHDLTVTKSEIVNLEVNGIPAPSGLYDIYLEQSGEEADRIGKLAVQPGQWLDIDPGAGGGHRLILPGYHLANQRLTIDFCTNRAEGPLPAGSVLLVPAGREPGDCEIVEYTAYRRDTELQRRPFYQNWPRLLERVAATDSEVASPEVASFQAMWEDMVDYAAQRQVLDPVDPHYGAIYSDEDKYSFRDAACAAVAFMQRFHKERSAEWKNRARLALDYAYRGQQFTADPEVLGGIGEMGMLGSKGRYRRIYEKPSGISGVDTGIIACHAVRALELGLTVEDQDIEALRHIAVWFQNNEYRLCQLRHHQGAVTDCQNSNAIGAAALTLISQFLQAQGVFVPGAWWAIARRTVMHVLDGQEAIGEWPYIFGQIGRGQKYHYQSIPDQGMLIHHLLLCRADEEFARLINESGCLPRLAYWYLLTSRFVEEGDITLDYEEAPGTGLGFSCFTWCRFMACAAIAAMLPEIGNRDFWWRFVFSQLQFIQRKLYKPGTGRAPVLPSVVPLTLHSWIQALEWNAVLLYDTLANLSKNDPGR